MALSHAGLQVFGVKFSKVSESSVFRIRSCDASHTKPSFAGIIFKRTRLI